MKRNKIIVAIMALSISASLMSGCVNTKEKTPITKVIERAVSIDYSGSPEQILSSYSEEGLREFKVRFPEKDRMDYALKQIGKKAPDFEFTNIKGDVINLSSLKGKKVVLDIIKTTCPVCEKTTPTLQKYAKENNDVVVIPVFPKDNKEDITEYYKKLKLEVDTTAVAGLDNSQISLIKDYELKRVPTIIFIDETGKISYAVEGDFDEVVLKDYHSTAFGEKKLYELVKKDKVEVDKDGKEIKVIESSTETINKEETKAEKDNSTSGQPTTPTKQNKSDN